MEDNLGLGRLELLLIFGDRVLESDLSKKLIQAIAISNMDSRLKKAFLLITLQDHLSMVSIDESLLEALELLEKLHSLDDSPVTTDITAAYWAIAVECTLKFLLLGPDNPAYLLAVDRIWRWRGWDEESNRSLLFSEELNKWRIDLEASLSDSELRRRLASVCTRRDAVQKLKVYLHEVWANVGHSFLEEEIAKLVTKELAQRFKVSPIELHKDICPRKSSSSDGGAKAEPSVN